MTISKKQSEVPRVLVIEGPASWSFFDDRGVLLEFQKSSSAEVFDWSQARRYGGTIEKLVIGSLSDVGKNKNGFILGDPDGEGLHDDFSETFPRLTHLHLWGLGNLRRLPALPGNLRCLDIRGSESLKNIENIPKGLERLIVEGAEALTEIPVADGELRSLEEISFSGSVNLTESTLHGFLAAASALKQIDFSGIRGLRSIHCWPSRLRDIRLNDCSELEALSNDGWPVSLRRLELRDSPKLSQLAPFPIPDSGESGKESVEIHEGLDYLDIRNTSVLKELPWASLLSLRESRNRPRTLLINGSRLDVPPEVFGETKDSNVADEVFAAVSARTGDAWDHDVKVILLGNGRCGKSSLVRRIVEDSFDVKEPSTHGIRLWRKELEFTPVDSQGVKATAGLQIWDFAGQDLYHNTHRLFLQSKAIFLLCWTDHGDGSCTETDAVDDDYLEEGEDDRRLLGYWLGQIKSLGKMPGTDRMPPILVVRTKVDRDETEARETEEDLGVVNQLECMDVSASTSRGIKPLLAWLSEQVAEVLGTSGRRSLGANRLAVKQKLEDLIKLNDQAAIESERQAKRISPPHPTMTRREFDEAVRVVCPEGPDHDHPELLLDLLHRSGFIYYNGDYLPDEIILDQRWAVNGIYGVFNRRAAWQNLVASGGIFTLTELSEWGWSGEGFSESEQQTFLRFMISCGICFEYVPASSDREAMYLAPHGLPSGKLNRIQREAEEYVVDFEAATPISIEDPKLGRDAIMQLLVSLARDWRRSALLWKWGGQFRSFADSAESEGFTYIRINWEPTDERKEYGGELTISLFGPDRSFLTEISDRCRALPGFRGIDIGLEENLSNAQEERFQDQIDLRGERIRSSQPESPLRHQPDTEDSLRVIALSFAGDPSPIDEERLGDAYGGSIETWPLAISAALKSEGFTVLQYREEQGKKDADKESDRKEFLKKIGGSFYLICFLSQKYLRSPYCMTEFLLAFRRIKGDTLDRHRLRIASLPGARFSESEKGLGSMKSFVMYWKNWQLDFNGEIIETLKLVCSGKELSPTRIGREIKTYSYSNWAEFGSVPNDLLGLAQRLRSWTHDTLGGSPDDESLKLWVDETRAATFNPQVLLHLAGEAWKQGASIRAKRLFGFAVFGLDPDGMPTDKRDALKRDFGAHLNPIRDAVLKGLEDSE